MTDVAEPIFFNPLEPGYTDDPFPHLAAMRAGEPVHQTIGRWVVFNYGDVFSLLRDPGQSVQDSNIAFHDEERLAMFENYVEGDLSEHENVSILNIDPPDHTRLRRLVSKAFTPRSIEALRPMIQARVDAALDAIAAQGTADVVDMLAFPLPFDIITDMLGMPPSDTEALKAWGEAIVKTLDPIITEEEVAAAVDAGDKMDAHVDEVILWKRDNPGDDLLTAMIDAEENGDRMTPRELRDQVTLLFVAGHETTVNLIGTGIYELLKRPGQAALMRGDAEADASPIDELLRFVSPVQFSRRITLTDTEFGGKAIPKGTMVMAGLASANRDEAKWGPTASELDLNRAGSGQHVSFGSGIHYCLGASLAKMEGEIAIGSFLRRFPDAEIVDAHFNGRINLRGLEKLTVKV